MKKKLVTVLLVCTSFLLIRCAKDAASSSSSSSNVGQNGSLTRFIIAANYLYTISNDALKVYDIANPAIPVYKNTQQVGFAIQTIFSYQDKLFIGSNNAMYIYSIAKPELPAKLSETAYFVRGKDPIVVVDSVAYSTVRNGFGGGGVLNCFNIKNISTPQNINVVAMTSPYGLGIKDSALYVCEGDSGIKVFNISKAYTPVLKNQLKFNETAYDVIVKGNTLICYIKGGVALFDIADIYKPSFIAAVKN
jgi:hypothetical protein